VLSSVRNIFNKNLFLFFLFTLSSVSCQLQETDFGSTIGYSCTLSAELCIKTVLRVFHWVGGSLADSSDANLSSFADKCRVVQVKRRSLDSVCQRIKCLMRFPRGEAHSVKYPMFTVACRSVCCYRSRQHLHCSVLDFPWQRGYCSICGRTSTIYCFPTATSSLSTLSPPVSRVLPFVTTRAPSPTRDSWTWSDGPYRSLRWDWSTTAAVRSWRSRLQSYYWSWWCPSFRGSFICSAFLRLSWDSGTSAAASSSAVSSGCGCT